MGLKAYKFETTMETGHRLPMYLVFRTLVIDNDKRQATMIFQGYPSREERERQLLKKENQFLSFSLVLSEQKYLALFLREIKNSLGFAVSDIVWETAWTEPFIADFVIDKAGNKKMVTKSLSDLQAEVVELTVDSLV